MMDFVLVLIALVHVHAQTSLIEVTQYNALVALFDSLGCSETDCPRGAPNTVCNSDNGTGKRILTCGLSSVSTIILNDMQLTGTIPSAIGALRDLSELRLQRNNITGTIPPVFLQLRSLRVLDLSNNKLFGDIPSSYSSGPILNPTGGLNDVDLTNNFLSGHLPIFFKGQDAPRQCNIQKADDTNCVICPIPGPGLNTKCECVSAGARTCPTTTTTFAATTTTSKVPSTTVVSTSTKAPTRVVVSSVRTISPDIFSKFLSGNVTSMASMPGSETVNSETVNSETVNSESVDKESVNSSKSDNGALIGGIVGGVIALLLIVGIIAVLMVRRARSNKAATNENGSNDSRVSVSAADTAYGTMNESLDGEDGPLPSYNDVGDVRKGNNAYY